MGRARSECLHLETRYPVLADYEYSPLCNTPLSPAQSPVTLPLWGVWPSSYLPPPFPYESCHMVTVNVLSYKYIHIYTVDSIHYTDIHQRQNWEVKIVDLFSWWPLAVMLTSKVRGRHWTMWRLTSEDRSDRQGRACMTSARSNKEIVSNLSLSQEISRHKLGPSCVTGYTFSPGQSWDWPTDLYFCYITHHTSHITSVYAM